MTEPGKSNEKVGTLAETKLDNAAREAQFKKEKEEHKQKQQKESFRFIFEYGRREASYFWLGLFFLLVANFGELATPYLIGKVIDYLQKQDFEGIGLLCLYMLIIIVVSILARSVVWRMLTCFTSKISGICVGMRSAIYSIMSERIARNLRDDFYESVLDKDISFFDERRTGELSKFLT